ncbi:MAG: hypothetical protein ACRBF0_07195 [Calditrichia bacterium]
MKALNLMSNKRVFFLVCLLIGILTVSAFGKEKGKINSVPSKNSKQTYLNVSYYIDSREYNTANILLKTSALPFGLDVFGFTDLHSSQRAGSRIDFTRHFMEYRLRRTLNPKWVLGIRGLAMEFEYNDLNGPGNHTLRIGPTFKHAIPILPGGKSWLQWRLHPYESDDSGWQASVIWFLSLSDRVNISGFADLNVNKNTRNQWISEPQLNFVVNQSLDIIIEARYNGFEDANPTLDGAGVTMGFKAKF